MSYDPIPDLAALIDGTQKFAGTNNDGDLVDLLTGPLARLRGGLLLDEPGREAVTTEQAIRDALAGAEAEIAALADEAERGYDVSRLAPSLPQSPYAWMPPAPVTGGYEPGHGPDLPVLDAATAVRSYVRLVSYYRLMWPEDRTRAVRKRLLELARDLPESERQKMPAWLLTAIRTGEHTQ